MKRHEIIKYITSAEMPDIEQVRENCVNQVTPVKNKISRRKRTLLITAVSVLIIMLAGAGINRYVVRVFNEDGSSYLQFLPFHQRRVFTDEELEYFEWRNEFFGYNEENGYAGDENILGLVFESDGGGSGGGSLQKIIYDYDEFLEFINQTDNNIFMTPQYIPDGYGFVNAHLIFHINENFDYETAELIERAEKFGYIHEKYYIPDAVNPANLNTLMLSYKKAGADGDYWLWYNIRLLEFRAIDAAQTGLETSQLEILQIPGFYRSSIMSTDYTENGISWTKYTFEARNSIPVIKYLKTRMLSKELREITSQYTGSTEEYGSVHYDIQSHFLSREEILKMAESIK